MIKLFCIPGGAASATAYLPWVKLLDKDVKLCLLEIPGNNYIHWQYNVIFIITNAHRNDNRDGEREEII